MADGWVDARDIDRQSPRTNRVPRFGVAPYPRERGYASGLSPLPSGEMRLSLRLPSFDRHLAVHGDAQKPERWRRCCPLLKSLSLRRGA